MTKEDKTFQALTQRLGEMVKENVELTERVKQLMSDYNKVVKQLQVIPLLSELTEAIDKVKKLGREQDFFKEHRQKLYEALFNQYGEQTKELRTVREAFKATKEQYNDLQRKYTVSLLKNDAANAELQKVGDTLKQLQDYNALLSKQLNTANSNCKEAEEKFAKLLEDYYTLKDFNEIAESRIARFEHSDIVSMVYECKYQIGVKVGSSACLGCEHCLIPGDTGTESILCAYNYDKEKQQEIENERRQRHRTINQLSGADI